jgi:hypothetical protein
MDYVGTAGLASSLDKVANGVGNDLIECDAFESVTGRNRQARKPVRWRNLRAALAQSAGATGTAASGAAKAVRAGAYFAAGKKVGIKIANVLRQPVVDGHSKHLVKITIVERAVPAHTDQGPAHDAAHGLRVELLDQQFHVTIVIAVALEVGQEAADRHVRNRK